MVRWLSENYDISRQEDDTFTYIYLHDCVSLDWQTLAKFISYAEFHAVVLRDDCICVKVTKP